MIPAPAAECLASISCSLYGNKCQTSLSPWQSAGEIDFPCRSSDFKSWWAGGWGLGMLLVLGSGYRLGHLAISASASLKADIFWKRMTAEFTSFWRRSHTACQTGFQVINSSTKMWHSRLAHRQNKRQIIKRTRYQVKWPCQRQKQIGFLLYWECKQYVHKFATASECTKTWCYSKLICRLTINSLKQTTFKK